jgi:hypothetical protein
MEKDERRRAREKWRVRADDGRHSFSWSEKIIFLRCSVSLEWQDYIQFGVRLSFSFVQAMQNRGLVGFGFFPFVCKLGCY